MSKKIKCWICGAPHDYCPTCGQTHGWKYVADKIECYDVYLIMEDYRSGALNKSKAAKELSERCGINAGDDLSWMLPQIEKIIREIIGEKEKATKKTENKSKLFD